MAYDLELEKAASEIKKSKAKLVCVQMPDGLKPEAKKIADYLEANTKAEILIYLGSCYGVCDVPQFIEKMGVDLLIQWGHSTFPPVKQNMHE